MLNLQTHATGQHTTCMLTWYWSMDECEVKYRRTHEAYMHVKSNIYIRVHVQASAAPEQGSFGFFVEYRFFCGVWIVVLGFLQSMGSVEGRGDTRARGRRPRARVGGPAPSWRDNRGDALLAYPFNNTLGFKAMHAHAGYSWPMPNEPCHVGMQAENI